MLGENTLKLTNELYNALKWLALVGLPAVATLYFALAGIWGWPDPEKVVGSITALDTALGIMLHLSSSKFSKENALIIVKPFSGPGAPPKS